MDFFDMNKLNVTKEQIDKLNVSRLLELERKKKGLSLDEVGSSLGVSGSYVFRMEKGKIEPKYDIRLRLVALFDLRGDKLEEYSLNDGNMQGDSL